MFRCICCNFSGNRTGGTALAPTFQLYPFSLSLPGQRRSNRPHFSTVPIPQTLPRQGSNSPHFSTVSILQCLPGAAWEQWPHFFNSTHSPKDYRDRGAMAPTFQQYPLAQSLPRTGSNSLHFSRKPISPTFWQFRSQKNPKFYTTHDSPAFGPRTAPPHFKIASLATG